VLAVDVDNGQGPILEVKELKKHFMMRKGIFARSAGLIKAVDGVNFSIQPGKTLGLVGESGCGKTTVGRAILRLIEPTSGEVYFQGRDLTGLNPAEMRRTRASLQVIFQDPFSSLNPRLNVGQIVSEPLQNHTDMNPGQIREHLGYLLDRVGLSPDAAMRYPHEFSGGQRQRVGIARALALSPKLIICDEPVSALDVSIQAQVINLLVHLQEEMGLSYLFIAHDLSVVEHISDFIAVMYLGRIVELASDLELYQNPKHPYTKALLSAVPMADPEKTPKRILLPGEVPSPLNPPVGCAFHPRCAKARDICRQEAPAMRGDRHQVACHMI
jgi:oligopeptide/dipeptide ABC transporter ATP-binding protein